MRELPLSLLSSTGVCVLFQVIQEIQDNGIQIYTGEIDEEEDSADIKELRVREGGHCGRAQCLVEI